MIFKFSDNLTYLEPFFEYLSCKAFDNKGYFTESQTPWFQQSYKGFTGGIPDYSCFYIEEFNELKKRKLLPKPKASKITLDCYGQMKWYLGWGRLVRAKPIWRWRGL